MSLPSTQTSTDLDAQRDLDVQRDLDAQRLTPNTVHLPWLHYTYLVIISSKSLSSTWTFMVLHTATTSSLLMVPDLVGRKKTSFIIGFDPGPTPASISGSAHRRSCSPKEQVYGLRTTTEETRN